MVFPIYECPVCGETWRIKSQGILIGETDEPGIQFVCIECNSVVMKQKYDNKGLPLCHLITDEELEAEDSFYYDSTDIDDDDLCLDPNAFYNE